MAAVAFESGNLVWQKVKIALANSNPGIVRAFKELKSHLSQDKRNPDLGFYAFTDAQLVNATGTNLASGVMTLYGAYVKKTGTLTGTATDSYFKIYDSATTDDASAQGRYGVPLLVADDERIIIDPQGLALATGLQVTAHTQLDSEVDATAGDNGNGFCIVGG